ncbi:MAG: S-methyl-5-thioribose-1-phosphate isomerase [Candidatus Sericytochromatia bacterium]
MKTMTWHGDRLELIDQTRLPHEVAILACQDAADVARAIKDMVVRGAPAIGVAAAYGVALGALGLKGLPREAFLPRLGELIALIGSSRPTAVNLFWALERMRRVAESTPGNGEAIALALVAEADAMHDEDIATNRAIGAFGEPVIPEGANVLTHCNAGALATVDYGTALGVIRAAHDAGKRLHVWVDETRPYLQGARLTAWELQDAGIPATLIADNMAGHFMARGQVDVVVTGADRIAANGDTANKIGTYSVAVLAAAHGIPFYIAAPLSTIDAAIPDGTHIPIEERPAEELTHFRGEPIAPTGMRVANPSFDVTPARLIAGIITEKGLLRPPCGPAIQALVQGENALA